MNNSIVIRVMSNAGRSRVEIAASASLAELKSQLATRLGLEAKTVTLYTDQAMKKALSGRDTDSLTKCGLKNGDMLHVRNEGATMTQLQAAPKFKSQEEIKQQQEEKAKGKETPLLDSGGRLIKAVEKKEETEAKDTYGKVL